MYMKVLLLNDTTDWYHFGCTATSTALKEEIRKLGYKLHAVPIPETYKILSVPETYEGFLDPDNYKKFTEANPALNTLLKEYDIIVINGEGTLHGARQAPMSLLYVAYIAKTVLRKHVEILNHSVYPQDNLALDNKSIVSIYQLVYQSIDAVYIREPVSFSLAEQMGIRAVESFDCMPLYIKHHYQAHGNKEDKTLLIAGSAAWLHLNIISNDRGNIEEFENGLSGFIDYLNIMSSQGYQLKFLYGAPEYPAKDDREFMAFIEPKLTKAWHIVTATSLDEWLGQIEASSLLVSGRFHHSIAASCLGTRFIILNSNTPKIEGLAYSLGMTVLNYNDPDIANKLLTATDAVMQKVGSMNTADNLAQKAMKNFETLKTFEIKKNLGVICVAATELIEILPLLKYLHTQMLRPLFPQEIKDLEQALTPDDFDSTSPLIILHLFCGLVASLTFPDAKTMTLTYNKILYPSLSTLNYGIRVFTTKLYQEALQNRYDKTLEQDMAFSFLNDCSAEIALSTTSAFFSSWISSCALPGIGFGYVTLNTFNALTISSVQCISTNKQLAEPSQSYSSAIVPYLVDAIALTSFFSKVTFNINTLPDSVMSLKQGLVGLTCIVAADQITKVAVSLYPNTIFEQIDDFFIDVYTSLVTPTELLE